ncbi:MAG: D-alanine--D-alanine ligase family protein [Clostridia bacterium]|nr:D-alanine--D-alanine ligase family protein [Clostridia bacterium]
MKISVGVLFGGKSVEHEVSVISAVQAMNALDSEKYDVVPIYITKDNLLYTSAEMLDIKAFTNIEGLLARSENVFLSREGERVVLTRVRPKKFGGNAVAYADIFLPVVHGTNVEDGTLAGFLEMIGAPYCGCDVASSAIGMDKYAQKVLLRDAGVNVLDAVCFFGKDFFRDPGPVVAEIERKFGYPAIVKPLNSGSSVGICVAHDKEALFDAIEEASAYSPRVLVERAIVNLREINCSVLGDAENVRASVLEEPLSTGDILAYDDKYRGGSSKGMSSLSRKIPAEVTSEQEKAIKTMCIKAFKALGCCGVVRIDTMIDADTGEIYFNEINTIPGSLAFYLWEEAGLSFTDMLDEVIALGKKRSRERRALTFSYDVNLLSEVGARGIKGAKGKNGR